MVYNSDLAYHQSLKDQEEQAKVAASRKKRPHATHADPPSSKAATVEAETPKVKSETWAELNTPNTKHNHLAADDPERAASPASSVSSASEPPLAQRVKTNGVNHSARSAPPAPGLQDGEDGAGSPVKNEEPSRASTSSAPPTTTRVRNAPTPSTPTLVMLTAVSTSTAAGSSPVAERRHGRHAGRLS